MNPATVVRRARVVRDPAPPLAPVRLVEKPRPWAEQAAREACGDMSRLGVGVEVRELGRRRG